MRKYSFLVFFLFSALFAAAQNNSSQDVFTITVAAPTSPRDIQVRYFLNGDPAVQQASSVARPEDNKIMVETAVAGRSARGFRAILYSPGCQFVTVTADDLSAGTRQAPFECQKLSTTSLHGKADVARFSGMELQVEALYVCRWAAQFFGVPGLSISPLLIGKAKVEKDGTFSLDLPAFSADPLWSNLSHNATLTLVIKNANGEQMGRLSAPRDLSRGGSLKVAASYPAEVEFGVR